MKLTSWLGLAIFSLPLYAQVAQPVLSTPAITERGPHHRVWEWSEIDDRGQRNVHSYTELATGLNVENSRTGQWEQSDEGFEIGADGYAVARRVQHRLILAPRINSAKGAVDLVTPDGKRFRSTLLGLSLFNRRSGTSLLIAELRSDPPSVGELVSTNIVLYRDCFDDLRADVRVENRRDGFHHDVILRESLDWAALEVLGFAPEDSQLETWTEWFEAPEPKVEARVVKRTSNASLRRLVSEPDMIDEFLDFGAMKFPAGVAYLTDGSEVTARIPVSKRWLKIEGRRFLLESCEISALKPMLAALPGKQSTPASLRDDKDRRLLAGRRPPSPLLALSSTTTAIRWARVDVPKEPGLVLDYQPVNATLTDYVFRGDWTYLVTGPTTCSGAKVTFEAGCVVKYSPSVGARLTILSGTAIDWQASEYRPIIMTARDDHSVGQRIGTGAIYSHYADPALEIQSRISELKHFRIAHALRAILYSTYQGSHTVRHAQFVNCQSGLIPYCSTLGVFNALFHNVLEAFESDTCPMSVNVQHGTFNSVNSVANAGAAGSDVAVVNCVFANVTQLTPNGNTTFSGRNNGFYLAPTFGSSQIASPAYPFVTVKAGQHYLDSASGLRNAGATSIDATLVKELKILTTYPPIEFSTAIDVPTTWNPQAQRDTDVPDCGYHYYPLDYLINNVTLTSSLMLTNGVAVGVTGNYGINLQSASASVTGEGTPLNPNRFTRYQTVQEQPVIIGSSPVALVYNGSVGSGSPKVSLRFTDVPALGDSFTSGSRTLINNGSKGLDPLSLTDCRLRGSAIYVTGYGAPYPVTVALTNNVLERGNIYISRSGDSTPVTAHMRNNLFWRTGLYLWYDADSGGSNPYWEIRDNLFDNCTATEGGNYNGYYIKNSHNGYAGTGVLLDNSSGGDKEWLSSDYVNGAFGIYCYPASGSGSSLAGLIGAGSRTVAAAGMVHYTVRADQAKDIDDPKVDIGFHYLAVQGLIGHWKLDEGTGISAGDASPYSHHGVLIGNPTWTAGRIAGALNFNGVNQFVSIANSSSLSFASGDFTIAVWVKPSSGGTVLAKGGGGVTSNTEYVLQVNAQGFFFRGSWWSSGSLNNVPTDGTWTHLASVYTAADQTLRFYRNGELWSSTAVSGAYASDTSQPFFIGTQGSGGFNDFAGAIDDVRLCNRSLDASEISSLFNNSSWDSWWDYDGDGLPDYVEDRNGNGVYDAGAGETNWQQSNGSGPGRGALIVFTPLH